MFRDSSTRSLNSCLNNALGLEKTEPEVSKSGGKNETAYKAALAKVGLASDQKVSIRESVEHPWTLGRVRNVSNFSDEELADFMRKRMVKIKLEKKKK